MVRDMTPSDAHWVRDIFQKGIDSGNSTFETHAPSWTDWDRNHIPHSRFVFEEEGAVVGWAALSVVSAREVYRGVAEISIYVHPDFHRRKIGTALMEKLISSSEKKGIWTLFSAVLPENSATLKLHEKSGFRIIGTRERIAKLRGEWRDSLILERRSKTVGI